MVEWIVITAPGSDIGKVVTEHLLKQGYGIIGMGRQNSVNHLRTLDAEHIHIFSCDYTDESSMEHAFSMAKSEVDKIRGLIHFVGGSLISKPYFQLDLASFRKVIAVNTDSAFLAGREASRWMRETGGGNIILFGSTTGIEPSSGKLAYGIAKAAVHNMTKSFALEGSEYDIIANTIAPAYVMTERHEREIDEKADNRDIAEKEILEKFRVKNPLHRILQPTELLDTVNLLLRTKVIQGQVINVDLGQVGIV